MPFDLLTSNNIQASSWKRRYNVCLYCKSRAVLQLANNISKPSTKALRYTLATRLSYTRTFQHYRRYLTSIGDKSIAQNVHQKLLRQYAEVLLRGTPNAIYPPPQHSVSCTQKQQSLRCSQYIFISFHSNVPFTDSTRVRLC